MKKFNRFKGIKNRSLYLPAITILMVIITLGVLHTVSMIKTLNRNREQLSRFIKKEGADLISILKAEVILEKSFSNRLREFLNEVIKNPGIAYIALYDGNDKEWKVWSKLYKFSNIFSSEYISEKEWEKGYFQKIRKLPNAQNIFEIGEYIEHEVIKGIIIGTYMTPLEEARRQDIHHAILMGVILLILGSGAFYFIFVVQNYYLINRTLSEMKSYTEQVVESMASGLITVDMAGNIVSTNKKAVDLLKLNKKAFREPFISVISSEYLDLNRVILYGEEIIEKEIDFQRGKELIPLSLSATPLKDQEGESIGAVIIIRDLSEIRELQEKVRRAERLASLGRLASGVAHEIRNPLSSIKGFAQYFREKFDEGSEDKSYAEIIIKEVERLNRVITQLLDFARSKELNIQPYKISSIIEHTLKLIQGEFKKRGINLKTSLLNYPIEVDWDQITQALLNMFLNSIESMNSGGELNIKTILKPEKRGVEIWISDTGVGISRENLTKIFDPFFSTKKGGTGLGLAITAKIIEAHKGEIIVESEEGRGTTFKIFLPLKKS